MITQFLHALLFSIIVGILLGMMAPQGFAHAESNESLENQSHRGTWVSNLSCTKIASKLVDEATGQVQSLWPWSSCGKDLKICEADLLVSEANRTTAQTALTTTRTRLTTANAGLATCRAGNLDLKALEDISKIARSPATPNPHFFINAFEYALYVEGYFTGPNALVADGIYDGETASAVRRYQIAHSNLETGWASPSQIRKAICFSAVGTPGHYRSRIDLAIMYLDGIGYPKSEEKADFLLREAHKKLLNAASHPPDFNLLMTRISELFIQIPTRHTSTFTLAELCS